MSSPSDLALLDTLDTLDIRSVQSKPLILKRLDTLDILDTGGGIERARRACACTARECARARKLSIQKSVQSVQRQEKRSSDKALGLDTTGVQRVSKCPNISPQTKRPLMLRIDTRKRNLQTKHADLRDRLMRAELARVRCTEAVRASPASQSAAQNLRIMEAQVKSLRAQLARVDAAISKRAL